MIQWALNYLKLGMSVIPLKPCGKEPLIAWQEFQSRKASESEVNDWFAKWPSANIGIVTGTISNVAVIDLDGPEGLKSAQEMGLYSPISSLTGRGKHLWYRHPGSPVGNAVRLKPGVDIRGDGGYVVAPGSIAANGRRYRWLGALNAARLPIFPTQFLNSVEAVSPIKKSNDGKPFNEKEEGWIAKALQEMKNGNIDETLFTVCSRLRADGYSAEDARLFLSHHASAAGATPGHLDEKIQNVWARYEPNQDKVQGRNNGITLPHNEGGLVIHSPTNSDSWEQYTQSQLGPGKTNEQGLKTGYAKLDAMLQGGIKSSRLFTLAARTGVGKTNWLISVARTLCVSGKKVLLFSTEMPYAQIWARYIATLEDPKSFHSHQFFICDSFAPNIERVEEAISEIKPDVFMFDHINHVSEEQRELGAFMQGLNFIRRKYDCAGIVTAQLNRSADWVDIKTGEKVTPRMSMIKGSGTIEQASSRVLLLTESRVTPEMTEITGNLDKNDNGPKGLIHFGLTSKPYRMVEL